VGNSETEFIITLTKEYSS